MALASISKEVEAVSRKLGLSAELSMLEHAWALEMGGLKNFVRILAIDKGTLVLEADSHAAMQDALLRRKELIRKMNKHFAAPLLQNLTVRIAEHHGR